MDFDDNEEVSLPPHHAYLFRNPKEQNLLAEYEVYNPSLSVRRLFSERNREIYSEAFIENNHVGPLTDLCIEAMAKLADIKNIPAIIRNDPLKMRIYYDSLNVDLPLKKCFEVDDMLYWRRVVLAKSSSQVLKLKKWNDYDWKSKGVSLKYVELVENCPAEFWPEKKMAHLAGLVKGSVKSMHIRRLKPLPATAFAHYMDSDSELDVTSSSSEMEEISSDEPDTEEENEDVEGEREDHETSTDIISQDSSDDSVRRVDIYTSREFSIVQADKQRVDRVIARHGRNEARQQLRNICAKRKAERDGRRQRREIIRQMLDAATKLSLRKTATKKNKMKIKGVFDTPVEPEPSDRVDKIRDMRNKEKLLRRIRRYDYPSEHCHHIDLSFVRHFNNLVSFHLEFLGPPGRVEHYQRRYLKFSFDDISRLSKGLRTLENLKIFRLRNSPLHKEQLLVLARALRTLNMLEEVDFGYDLIPDDCCIALSTLLQRKKILKVLQLEYNKLGKSCMEAIVFALSEYEGDEPLDYLGLAHNPITSGGLSSLIRFMVHSKHVEKLNISAIEVAREIVANEVCRLLRLHSRLRHLDMAALPLDPSAGVAILRAIKSNSNILYIDCRDCDLGEDAEFEIDILIRRNRFLLENNYVGDTCQSEENICNLLMNRKHPIVEKIQGEQKKKTGFVKNRLNQSPSKTSLTKAVEVKRDTAEDYDIWADLGVKSQLPRVSKKRSDSKTNETVQSLTKNSFAYNPNLYNIDQFRQFVHQPGPSNRYYYIKNNRGPYETSH
ncbi:uncharacterized protein Dwil_GK20609 [Drosophila willistoni]|uniref:T-complex-associated testis-expressed protein 1 n=1 Tax=Drosophila willistoni TaxID=7260 RepID=B4MIF7_DROWI|nr:uncharacterized protein Dwil_GK20609 [Drosophila willistoni]